MLSLPGFGASVDAYSKPNNSIESVINPLCEWRYEIAFKSVLLFKILSGQGEIFGKELPNNVEISLCGTKGAIYCPGPEPLIFSYYISANSNNLSSESDEFIQYTSSDSVMSVYTNLHLLLEARRQQCVTYNAMYPGNTRVGPRVLILGLRSTGKTSLCKILVSYAQKMNCCPILVNLEPRDGVFAIPGSITATPISDSLQVECSGGYGFTTTSGSLFHNPKQPIVKNIGFPSFCQNGELYKEQVSHLGVTVLSRLHEDDNLKCSGAIIDTPSLTIKDFKLIENIVSDFEVDVIVVMGNERLVLELTAKYQLKVAAHQLDIVRVPISGGVVQVDESFIRRSQEECIKEYFYGNHKTRLSPFKTEIDLREAVIYKGILSLEAASRMAFLPAGDSYTADEKLETDVSASTEDLAKYHVRLMNPSSSNMDNLVIAVTHLPQTSARPKDIINASVMGYIHVCSFDDTKDKMKVLLPYPCAVPRNVMFATSVNYTD